MNGENEQNFLLLGLLSLSHMNYLSGMGMGKTLNTFDYFSPLFSIILADGLQKRERK